MATLKKAGKDGIAFDRVVEARAHLILEQPFFGALALRLNLVEDRSFPTMWVDGKTMAYNPAFVKRVSNAELIGCVCHEVLHCVLQHIVRRENRDVMKWGLATDLAINAIISDCGLELPVGVAFDSSFAGMSAEEIYYQLPDMSPPKMSPPKKEDSDDNMNGSSDDSDEDYKYGSGSGSGNGYLDPGQVRDAPASEHSELEQEWNKAVQQAAKVAKSQGQLPLALETLITEALRPRMDWRALLRQYVQACVDRTDYSWRFPNKRFIGLGTYMPGLHGENIPPIVVAIDTSGSISSDEFVQFVSEVKAIVEDVRPECTYVLYADAEVQRVDEWETGYFDAAQALLRSGHGGTSFVPVFEWIAEKGIAPACLIYLTDTYGSFPNEPEYPVIWAKSSPQGSVPWGHEVVIES